jgi:hypothetical protein
MPLRSSRKLPEVIHEIYPNRALSPTDVTQRLPEACQWFPDVILKSPSFLRCQPKDSLWFT